jgi:hypothetical protein
LVLDDGWTLLNGESLLLDVDTLVLEPEILVLDDCWTPFDGEIELLLGDTIPAFGIAATAEGS